MTRFNNYDDENLNSGDASDAPEDLWSSPQISLQSIFIITGIVAIFFAFVRITGKDSWELVLPYIAFVLAVWITGLIFGCIRRATSPETRQRDNGEDTSP